MVEGVYFEDPAEDAVDLGLPAGQAVGHHHDLEGADVQVVRDEGLEGILGGPVGIVFQDGDLRCLHEGHGFELRRAGRPARESPWRRRDGPASGPQLRRRNWLRGRTSRRPGPVPRDQGVGRFAPPRVEFGGPREGPDVERLRGDSGQVLVERLREAPLALEAAGLEVESLGRASRRRAEAERPSEIVRFGRASPDELRAEPDFERNAGGGARERDVLLPAPVRARG